MRHRPRTETYNRVVDGRVLAAWENDDGSTRVSEWLDCYDHDENVYWITAPGHIQNVLDALISSVGRRGDFKQPLPPDPGNEGKHHVLKWVLDES